MPGNLFDLRYSDLLDNSRAIWNYGPSCCARIFEHPKVQSLINSKHHHFEAILAEALANESVLGSAHKFKAPIIQICPFGDTHWMGDWVGNPNPYAYIPDAFLDYSPHMGFWQRLRNTPNGIYWRMGQEFYSIPLQEAVVRRYFNYTDDIPPLSEIVPGTSLLLLNNHFSLNQPKPLVRNMVEVGRMHPPKRLQEVRPDGSYVAEFCYEA